MASLSTGSGRHGMKAIVAATALALGGLALAGCGISPDYVDRGEADVSLYIVDINGGTVFNSDVRTGDDSNTVAADNIDVTIANRSKNPTINETQVPRAIILRRYTVRYFRSDGRNTPGVDVPYSISGDLRTAIDVSDSENLTIALQVVRAQAKLDPPLTNLRGVVPGALGGSALILSAFAEITLYGETVSGKAVSASGTVQIDFADFPE
jgi:hypothetical protein